MTGEWDVTRTSIGSLSIWTWTAALFAPRTLPWWLGLDPARDIALGDARPGTAERGPAGRPSPSRC